MVVIFSLNLQNTSEKFPFGIGSYKSSICAKTTGYFFAFLKSRQLID